MAARMPRPPLAVSRPSGETIRAPAIPMAAHSAMRAGASPMGPAITARSTSRGKADNSKREHPPVFGAASNPTG